MELATDLIPLVQLRLRGCPEETAAYGLRLAFARLCRETDCWRDTSTFVVSGSSEINAEDDVAVKLPSMSYTASIGKVHYLMVERDNGNGGFYDPARIDPDRYRLRHQDEVEIVFKATTDIEDGDRITMEVSVVPYQTGGRA